MSITSILSKFQNELNQKKDLENDPLHEVIATIDLCQNYLNLLRRYVDKFAFKSKEDEIIFFKQQKQIPQTELVFQVSLKNFYFNKPKSSKDAQLSYCNNKLTLINEFFTTHREFDNYIRLNRFDLDTYYFTRSSSVVNFENSEPYYKDPIFSTARDLVLSKLTAYQKYIDFILDYKQELLSTSKIDTLIGKNLQQLEWTGSKAALTELIYALYTGRIINNGNIEIKDIAAVFSKIFKYELGDFYKTYSEIKARKNSRTKFLDNLSASLISQMDSSEE
ncbi:RteC domain-containing protein [Dokdonia genika]|uniref:RteC domain-containing protein n=1 Tax=Dokdonia genika TaxID=308113 RepID=A0ABV9L9Z6_9FLAO